MITFDTLWTSPTVWVADQLAGLPAAPARRAVVLVAAERQAHAVRRHLCVERGNAAPLAGVRFVRPVDFARELLLRAGIVRSCGWEDARRLRILQLFASASLTGTLRYFNAAQLQSGQGYVDAFARTIAVLEDSGIDAGVAEAVAARLAREDRLAADRLHDVAVTWQAADAELAAWRTAAQILTEAAKLLGARPQVAAPFGPVITALSASPTAALLRFLGALPTCRAALQEARPLRHGAQRWRALAALPAAAETPVPEAASELDLVRRFVFETPEVLTDPERPRSRGADGSVDLEAYPSIEDETEAAATWVAEQVEAGVALEQIALIVPEIDPYAPLLIDRLQRLPAARTNGRLAAYVAGGLSLAASPGGRRLRGLLHALARALDAESTIRVIPALRRGEHDAGEDGRTRLSPSRVAEIVYGAGIVGGSPGDAGGAGEWLPRLIRRRDALRKLLDDAEAERDADEPEKRHHVIGRQHAQRWLKDVEPILPAVAALQQLAQTILAAAPLPAVWQALRAFAFAKPGWLRLPPDPPDLLNRLEERLQPVLTDPRAGAVGGPAALRVITDALRDARCATARFGEPCVFIGTAAQAAGLAFAGVRVLGAAEGALPHSPHDDPILPDGLRQRAEQIAAALEPGVVVPRLADAVLDELHDVFRVIGGATRCLALSAPRQWVDRSEREVSGIMLEIATALGRPIERPGDEGDVPTAARLRSAYLNPGRAARQAAAAARPLSPRAVVAAIAARAGTPLGLPSGWLGGTALALDRLREILTASDHDTVDGSNGIVDAVWPAAQRIGLSPQKPLSASAATRLLECPHRFLLERILHLAEPTAPPATDSIEPVAYGSLFHAAAERFFRAHGKALCRHTGRLEQFIARAREIADEEFDALRDEYPLRGADAGARERERLGRQVEQLVRYEWQAAAREFVATELDFGEPQALALDVDGGTLYVRGAIDRVDRLDAGTLSVRDLKTGRVRDFAEEPISARRDLQLGLYVLALEAAERVAGARVAAAVYVHPSAAQEPERAFVGADLDLLRRQTREWLAIAHGLLAAGAFPRTPNVEDCLACPFVPACGEEAQQRSAAQLGRVSAGHALQPFARFKLARAEAEE